MFGTGISVGTSGIGPQGAIGSQGASSAAGAQGNQGFQGRQGAGGAQGSQGAQGAQGSGNWSPLNLPNLVGWWDASDAATITSSGGAVSQWDDKSGNSYHLKQTTAGLKPTTGATTQNGLNVLDFATDKLVTDSWASQSQPNTVVFVVKGTTRGGIGTVFDSSGASRENGYGNSGGAFEWMYYSASTGPFATSATIADTDFHVVAYVINGASSSVRVDGAASATVNMGTNALAAQLIIGANIDSSQSLAGSLGELVFCNAALGTSDLEAVEAYLATKWGTP